MDNKLFWTTKQPSLSDRLVVRNRIHLTEKDKIVKTGLETAETLNSFFANVTNNLKISNQADYGPLVDIIENRTIKVLLKYRNHPSILASHQRKKTGESLFKRNFYRGYTERYFKIR